MVEHRQASSLLVGHDRCVDLPLLEGDFDSEGVIEPAVVVPKDVDMPERAVLCFFGDVVAETVAARSDARQVTMLSSEAASNPVWEINLSGRRLAVFQPGVGAPWAAAFLEEVVAMGCRRLMACGGAGALIPELVMGHAVVVDSVVRDEGTSHHYLPPSRVIDADPDAVATLADTSSCLASPTPPRFAPSPPSPDRSTAPSSAAAPPGSSPGGRPPARGRSRSCPNPSSPTDDPATPCTCAPPTPPGCG